MIFQFKIFGENLKIKGTKFDANNLSKILNLKNRKIISLGVT